MKSLIGQTCPDDPISKNRPVTVTRRIQKKIVHDPLKEHEKMPTVEQGIGFANILCTAMNWVLGMTVVLLFGVTLISSVYYLVNILEIVFSGK